MARLIAQPVPRGKTFGCWPGPWPLATGVSVEFPRLSAKIAHTVLRRAPVPLLRLSEAGEQLRSVRLEQHVQQQMT